MTKNITESFKILIILECFYLINRNFLLNNKRTETICNIITIIISLIVIACLCRDYFNNALDMWFLALDLYSVTQIVYIAITARARRNTYKALNRLHSKCAQTVEHFARVKRMVKNTSLMSAVSALIDLVALTLILSRPGAVLLLSIAFSGFDADIAFISVLINIINGRLKELRGTENVKMYRHILIVMSHFDEELSIRVSEDLIFQLLLLLY